MNAKRRSSASPAAQMQIDALHQQRPSARWQRGEVGGAERSVRERPACRLRARRAAIRRRRGRRARTARARDTSPRSPGIASRTSSARFCQCRRRNAAGVRPPSRFRSRRRTSRDYSCRCRRSMGALVAVKSTTAWTHACAARDNRPDRAMNIFSNTVVTLTLQALFRQRRADRGVAGADHLSARRAPRHFPEDRGGAGAKEGRRPGLGHARARRRVRRIRRRAGSRRAAGPLSAGRHGRHAVRRAGDGDDQDGIVCTSPTSPTARSCVDGNHELAGQRLRFDCTVLDVRPATAEELAHGHVHGAHGHHH